MNIAIVGSRDFPRPDLVAEFMLWLDENTNMRSANHTIISGAAPGVDSWALCIADEVLHWPIQPIPAEWRRHGRGAGFVRNTDIVAACDYVAAFWDGESHGTMDTIHKARRAGKVVEIIRVTRERPQVVTVSK